VLTVRLCLVAAWIVTAGVPSEAAETPSSVVAAFYKTYLDAPFGGLPSRAQQDAMAARLSLRLLELLEQARSIQEEFIRTHRDEKPPWSDGCLFASLSEGPRRFRVSKVSRQADGTFRVQVHFWYEEGLAGWEDAVVVRREGGRLVIDDILLSGAGPFNPPGRLSSNLQRKEK
jgi:hypothetical protein